MEGGALGGNRLDGSWNPSPWCVSSLPSFPENSSAALKARVCGLGPCKVLPHVSPPSMAPSLFHASLFVANSLTLVEPLLGTPHFSTLCHGEEQA